MTATNQPAGPTGPGWQPPSGFYLAATRRRPSLDRVVPARLLSALIALASVPGGAFLLAVLFGLIALPTVIYGVPGYDMSVPWRWLRDAPALDPLGPAVLSASIGAVLASVIVAAPLGSLVVRRFTILGATLTFLGAWIAGILALPVLPSLLGYRYGAVNFCLDSCQPQIVGMGGGLRAFFIDDKPNPLGLFFSPFYGFLPLVALVVGVTMWVPIVRRASDQRRSNR